MNALRAIVVFCLFAGATRAEMLSLSGATMGTSYHVKISNSPATLRPGQLHADVKQVLARIDQQMSTWRDDSEVSRFNHAPAGEWFAVSPAVAEVVLAAQEISRRTDGALDVTVGPLVRLWRFGPDAKSNRLSQAPRPAFVPPDDAAVARTRKVVGYKNLEVRIEPPALRKAIEGLEIDLSSLAPGYAIDRLSQLLMERGLTDWLVEIGGEVRVAGKRDNGGPWQVAIERPVPGKPQLQSVVPLSAGAISTAGDYQKFFEYRGIRYSHIIDPVTGRPVDHSLSSVTVAADTCLAADGWDTPLLVLGAERGYECAVKHKIAALFIERAAKAAGTEREEIVASPAWQERIGDSVR